MEKNSHRKVWKRFRNNRRGKKKIKRKEDMMREETWKIKIKSKREGQIGIGGDITRSLTLTGRFFWREVIIFSAGFWGAALHTSLRPILRMLLSVIPRASSRNISRAWGLQIKSES